MIILKGAPVAKALNGASKARIARLALEGVGVRLFIVRVGHDDADAAYLRGISRSAEACGLAVELAEIAHDVPQGELNALLRDLSRDPKVSGILLMRPLPEGLSEEEAARCIAPEKDVDAMGERALAQLFSGNPHAFAPATAKAVLELLDHYGYDVAGRVGCVLGRSTVVGRPLQALLTSRDATVTLCHSKTPDLEGICRRSEFIVSAVGVAGFVTPQMVSPGTWVVDVGINVDDGGKLVGDVAPRVADVAEALTPVPGGVGVVTAATLVSQVVRAAEGQARARKVGSHG